MSTPPAPMPRRSFGDVETWIFDLDNTLYPPGTGLLCAVDARITGFIARELAVGPAEADRLRRAHWLAHGITLRGLMAEHGVSADAFLAEVHAVDLSGLAPDPRLARAVAGLPGRRIVHTNSARAHAERVLAALGLSAHFDAVFAIEDKALVPKPRPRAYAHVLAATGADPRRAAMIEDTAANLVEPGRLGMATVWLAHDPGAATPDHVDARIDDLAGFLEQMAPR